MKTFLRFTLISFILLGLTSFTTYAQAPGWTPAPNQNYTMSVVGVLELEDGTITLDPNDIIAGFVDGECRGIASPLTDPGVEGILFLQLGSNQSSGETIQFKAYIADSDMIYDLNETLTFSSMDEVGTLQDPFVFTLADMERTISASSGANGSITPEGDIVVAYGEDQSFVIEADEGYHIDDVEVDGVSVGAVDTYEFTNVTENHTIHASFAINTYTLNYLIIENGSLVGETTQNVTHGSNGSAVEVIPDEGYFFVSWDDGNTDNPRLDQNITNDSTVTALVEIHTYTLQYLAGDNGSISGDALQTVDHGASGSPVEAIPDLGYQFASWSDGITDNPRTDTDVTENVEVTAQYFITGPGWIPVPNQQYSMQVVAEIIFDEQVSTNPEDVLGAFVDGQCRGIGYPDPDLNGLIFMTVGSNTAAGDTVELRLWNSVSEEDCIAAQSFIFEDLSQLGQSEDPYSVECQVQNTIQFGQGFTWFSLNIDLGSLNPNDYFNALSPAYNDRLIGQTSFSLYTGSQWVGGLTALDYESMYRMRLSSSQEFSIAGARAPIEPIQLSSGFTWIGYQPQECQPINIALNGLADDPTYDDRLIGQNAFALYNGVQWIGSLTQMCPGEGYIIRLAEENTLLYPSTNNTLKHETTHSSHHMQPNPTQLSPAENLKHTMMLVAELEIDDHLKSENNLVFAIIDGECRGMASQSPAAAGLVFMNIGANNEDAAEISFKIWIDHLQQMMDLTETLNFAPLQATGSLDEPFKFSIHTPHQKGLHQQIGAAKPNPFSSGTSIPYTIEQVSTIKASLYNSIGKHVRTITDTKNEAGLHHLTIFKENLLPGLYFLVFEIESSEGTQQKTTKLIIH